MRLSFILLTLVSLHSHCQVNSFTDTITYELIGKQKKECIGKFTGKLAVLTANDSLNITMSEDKDVFTGKGKLHYDHVIDFDTADAFVNKTYVGQVHGSLNYRIRIEFQKKMILVTLHDFEHIAKGNRYGKRSLGKINFSDHPVRTKDEELIWLEKVRKDIVVSLKNLNVGFKLWFLNTML